MLVPGVVVAVEVTVVVAVDVAVVVWVLVAVDVCVVVTVVVCVVVGLVTSQSANSPLTKLMVGCVGCNDSISSEQCEAGVQRVESDTRRMPRVIKFNKSEWKQMTGSCTSALIAAVTSIQGQRMTYDSRSWLSSLATVLQLLVGTVKYWYSAHRTWGWVQKTNLYVNTKKPNDVLRRSIYKNAKKYPSVMRKTPHALLMSSKHTRSRSKVNKGRHLP